MVRRRAAEPESAEEQHRRSTIAIGTAGWQVFSFERKCEDSSAVEPRSRSRRAKNAPRGTRCPSARRTRSWARSAWSSAPRAGRRSSANAATPSAPSSLQLTFAEYERVRSTANWFVAAVGHDGEMRAGRRGARRLRCHREGRRCRPHRRGGESTHVSDRGERVGVNESLFREVNERIDDLQEHLGDAPILRHRLRVRRRRVHGAVRDHERGVRGAAQRRSPLRRRPGSRAARRSSARSSGTRAISSSRRPTRTQSEAAENMA